MVGYWLVPYFVTFIVTLSVIGILRPVTDKLGLVAVPCSRKVHHGNIPLIGGFAALLGFIIGLLTLHVSLEQYGGMLVALCCVIILGILDDIYELSAWVRLIGQFIIASIVVAWGGVAVNNLGNLFFIKDIYLHAWSVPFTLFGVVLVINAINMIDGIDGLAGTVVFLQLAVFAILAFFGGRIVDLHILLLVMSAVLAFLCFNFPIFHRKAKLFMGDVGSMFLGLILVWFAITFSQETVRVAAPITFLWILAVPLFDLIGVIYRRAKNKISPFKADRGHLHHLLRKAGIKPLHIVFIISALSILCGIIGVIGEIYAVRQGIMFLLFIFCLLLFLFVTSHTRLFKSC